VRHPSKLSRRLGSEHQGLRDSGLVHRGAAVEVGDGPSDPQRPIEAARGEAEPFRRRAEEGERLGGDATGRRFARRTTPSASPD